MKQILALALFLFPLLAGAIDIVEWKEKDYLESKTKGQTYILHFYAEWCSVCLAQKKAVKKFELEKDFKDLKVYLVDFDFASKLKKEFGVERQSTMIIFRGDQEISRIMGITDPEKIREFFKKAL